MMLVVSLSLVIGLLLGLLGGGGSILTVPLLVYLLHLEPKTAMATSLVIVGVTSLTAMVGHARAGRVCWRTGLIFGLAGMVGAYGGGRLAAFIPGGVLLLIFAAVMLGTAWAMLRSRPRPPAERTATSDRPPCPTHLPLLAILFDGLAVGAVTGLVGAGGGFLVVPALALLGGLPMHAAVGTSLLVIGLKSFAALAGYVSHVSIDGRLVVIVTIAAIVGSLVGGKLSHRVSPTALRRGFGVFVMLVAAYLLHRELSADIFVELWGLLLQHTDFLWGVLSMAALLGLARLRNRLHMEGERKTPSRATSP